MIRKVGAKWILYDSSGSKILGRHDTKEGAEAQEEAINARKHALNEKIKRKMGSGMDPITFGEIKGAEIFEVGRWHGIDFTDEDLTAMVKNFEDLHQYIKPPLKLGHTEKQILAQEDGQPALGWVERVYKRGAKLFADISHVPEKIIDLVKRGAYRRVSPEIFPTFEKTPLASQLKTGTKGCVLGGLSLLGAQAPEVKTLADLWTTLMSEGVTCDEHEGMMLFEEPEMKKAGTQGYLNISFPESFSLEQFTEIMRREIHEGIAVALAEETSSEGDSGSNDNTGGTDMAGDGKDKAKEPEMITMSRDDLKALIAEELKDKNETITRLGEDVQRLSGRADTAERETSHVKAEQFADKAMSDGRITQAMKPFIVLLHGKLGAKEFVSKDEGKMLFAEGEEPRALTGQETLEKLVKSMPDLKTLMTETSKDTKSDEVPDEKAGWDGIVRMTARAHSIDVSTRDGYLKAAEIALVEHKDKLPRFGEGAQ